MVSKKNKSIVAGVMAVVMAAGAVLPCAVSAAGTRTKAEAFGDSTYKERFLSLYDDVITNGETNGYLSSASKNNNTNSFGVPYHSVETLICEAPDYGHETTSEAMSYIVWVAAMKDHLSGTTGDYEKAWNTMEEMVPTEQSGFFKNSKNGLSAQYAPESGDPKDYPSKTMAETWNTCKNPIGSYFPSAYSNSKGLYLLHWLADVDNWYGYGSGTDFTFINTFQRGAQESCWETIPHPSIETLQYGPSGKGIAGVFNGETNVAKQWRYTNAPDAEDRAIQAVYWANKWGVGNSEITAKAAMMGDECRNNMFDKYYKKIGCQSSSSQSAGYEGCHYLMSWYTSWGGALDSAWSWQIGASHIHEFYQNPLAAYALLNDSELNKGMKAQDATKDYQTSLERQLDFYLWLQSNEGPIAGGATNSYNGRYDKYPSDISTFNDLAYVPHPVYEDPGSNHWFGNQVWAMQRIAELYRVSTEDGKTDVANKCKKILDKWVAWALKDGVHIDDKLDTGFEIVSNLDWEGQPDTWTGTATDNTSLHATVRDYSNGDLGCTASLANILINYAKVNGADASAATKLDTTNVANQALYTARELLDCMWKYDRDDIGLTVPGTNGSYDRFFTQEVWVPKEYGSATLPNGAKLENGATFLSLRPKYEQDKDFAALKADFDDNGKTDTFEFSLHRFWHAGDIMIALGTMTDLYPTVTPDPDPDPEAVKLDKTEVTVAVGESDTVKVTEGTVSSWESEDPTIATVDSTGKITGIGAGTTTVNAIDAAGNKTAVKVTVEAAPTDVLYGDVNLDEKVNILDVAEFCKIVGAGNEFTNAQAKKNADCVVDGNIDMKDALAVLQFITKTLSKLPA